MVLVVITYIQIHITLVVLSVDVTCVLLAPRSAIPAFAELLLMFTDLISEDISVP